MLTENFSAFLSIPGEKPFELTVSEKLSRKGDPHTIRPLLEAVKKLLSQQGVWP